MAEWLDQLRERSKHIQPHFSERVEHRTQSDSEVLPYGNVRQIRVNFDFFDIYQQQNDIEHSRRLIITIRMQQAYKIWIEQYKLKKVFV